MDNVDPVQNSALASGAHTNDATPTLAGTAVTGSTISVYDNGTLLDTVTANGSGAWSYTPSGLADGSHSFTTTATDGAGNVSDFSAPFVLRIDTVLALPTIAGAADNADPVQGSLLSGAYTNDTTPTLSGTAEAGSTVRIFLDAGADPVATVTANGSGGWSYTAAVLSDGLHSFVVTATDLAGNVATSAAFELRIDTLAPSPSVVNVTDDVAPDGSPAPPASVPNNGYTNDRRPTFSGSGEQHATVTIMDGMTPLVVAMLITAANGSWNYPPTADLSTGSHTFTVTVTDRAGNVSTPTTHTLTIDVTPPAAPGITLNTDAGNVVLGTYTVTGVESGATVEHSADSSAWQSAPLAFVPGDNTIYVRQIDQAGNPSTATLLRFLYGTAGNDTLIDDGGANILIGGGGDDILEGKGGADKLYGDGGNNTASYASSSNVTASLTSSFANGPAVVIAGDASGDSYFNIHNLTGSAGHDILIGDSGVNILKGGDGDDILEGMDKGDKLYGEGGNNTASYAHAPAVSGAIGVIASLADPSLNTGHAADDQYFDIQNLIGSIYNDILYGDGGNNILMGGPGADHLYGGGNIPVDLIDGSGGDTASYANATAGVWASLDSTLLSIQDLLGGDASGDRFYNIENLTGSAFNDTLRGNSENNILRGSAGNDTLIGGGGDDWLDGGNGDDILYADQGRDSAYGGDGNDTFYISALPENLPMTIDGGDGTDTIVVQGLGATYDLTALANVSSYIETLNIKDTSNTEVTVTSADIRNMVDNGDSSQLTIRGNTGGDTLNIVLSGSESMSSTEAVAFSFHGNGTYTIYDGTNQIAQILWNTAA